MDLVRHILSITADHDTTLTADSFTDGYPRPLVEYHIKIMQQAGLLDADTTPFKSGGSRDFVFGLTWEGQDFLAAVEDDTIWSKTVFPACAGMIPEVRRPLLKADGVPRVRGDDPVVRC